MDHKSKRPSVSSLFARVNICLLFSAIFTVTTGFAGEKTLSKPELVTDRPDQTESSVVVPPGYVQLETGWTFSHNKADGIRNETHEFPGTLLRIGVLDRVEFRLGPDRVKSRLIAIDNKLVQPGSASASGAKRDLTRIVHVQNEISLLPVKDEYLVTTSEFDRVKSCLIAIDNKLVRPGGASTSGAKRPSLKRKTNTNRSEEEKPTLKSERPTLKREKPDDPEPDPGR